MLTDRRAELLNLIVREYVETALPVGSQYVVRKHAMPYSPATVRLEMARLEEDGYINQPHTSAGRIPSDKGYRYYIETLMQEEDVAWEEQQTIRHQFHQAERALEEWFQLTAAVLSRMVSNFAVVTAPRSKQARLRHVQLVSLHELSILCVAVLQEARVRQQVLSLRQAADQAALNAVADRINRRLGQGTATDLRQQQTQQLPAVPGIEETVVEALVDLLEVESLAVGDIYRDGVREVLSQPEFARSERMIDLIDLLEQRSLASAIPVRSLSGDQVSVVIGAENASASMQECSIVVSSYGRQSGATGVVAVLGPTRMDYARTVPIVRFVAGTLGELVSQI
jgi:heat-inducible transcriptional repressor